MRGIRHDAWTKQRDERGYDRIDADHRRSASIRTRVHAIMTRVDRATLLRRLGRRFRRPRETLNDGDQLLVRRAPGVAKRVDRMFVREPAQAQQLAGALAPVQV